MPGTISSDITGTASFINVTANNSTNENVYLLFADDTTDLKAETDSSLRYNPSTNLLTAGSIDANGSLLSSLNANNFSSGTLATAAGTVGNATPTAGAIAYGSGSAYLFNSQGTSGQVLLSGGSGVSYLGNTSGLTVGNATNITLADESSDTTCFPIFATSATGNQPPKTDSSALTYNASSGYLLPVLLVMVHNLQVLLPVLHQLRILLIRHNLFHSLLVLHKLSCRNFNTKFCL